MLQSPRMAESVAVENSLDSLRMMALSEGNEHVLKVKSYKVPTFCDFCGVLLMGLIQQGLRCKACGQNYHKKCIPSVPSVCSQIQLHGNSTENLTQPVAKGSSKKESSPSDTSGLKGIYSPGTKPGHCKQGEHTFASHTYTVPTVCFFCKKLLLGLVRQGKQCHDCKLNAHKQCINNLERNEQLEGSGITMDVSD